MKYRRKIPKPIEFEAERWLGGEHPAINRFQDKTVMAMICDLCHLPYSEHGYYAHYENGLLTEAMPVCPGDWILHYDDRYIIYNAKYFENNFEPVPQA